MDWVRAKQERQGISRYFEDFKSHIAVSSCIFGAWDNLRTPTNRKISFDSREDYEYAIFNHYYRHCAWEEVAQNKRLNKFNHSLIDEQFQFYQREELPRFNVLNPNRYLPSRKACNQIALYTH